MYTDIIWDFDGTLIDTYKGMVEVFQKMLEEENISAEADEILSYMKKSQGAAMEYYIKKYNLDESFCERFTVCEHQIEDCKRIPYDGVIAICEKVVKNGGRNFVVTHRGNTTVQILKYHNMLGLFTEIVTKHNGFKRKPDPEAFTYLVEKYNMDKAKALGVGDRELDIMAASNAGIATCLFKSDEVSCSIKPDYTIASIHDLENIIF